MLDPLLRVRLSELMEEGQDVWQRFDREVRQREFHAFVPAEYEGVLATLLALHEPGLRFLEWGSATGVITIMADLLGYEAYGIEIDAGLVDVARDFARRFDSGARFAAGSFMPAGYRWRGGSGDARLGTLEEGASGYLVLQRPLDEFDLVYGYPWSGEEPVMRDVMKRYASPDARLLLNSGEGIRIYRRDRLIG
jgi:hypothetical protein